MKNQRFDGIDIDYGYCYDVGGSQQGRCLQRTNNYSDVKAQKFLADMTSLLRRKLDGLGSGYEVTHAPLDSDLLPSSKYYQILKDQHTNLDFLMPQFYNGFTRPHVDGVGGKGIGHESAISMFDNLANDMFDSEPEKVCVSLSTVTPDISVALSTMLITFPSYCMHCAIFTGRVWVLHFGLRIYRVEYKCQSGGTGHVGPQGVQQWRICMQRWCFLVGGG